MKHSYTVIEILASLHVHIFSGCVHHHACAGQIKQIKGTVLFNNSFSKIIVKRTVPFIPLYSFVILCFSYPAALISGHLQDRQFYLLLFLIPPNPPSMQHRTPVLDNS